MMRLVAPALLLVGCTDKGSDDSGEPWSDEANPVCEEPADVVCVDDLILDLSLHDDQVSEGAVTTDADGDDFVTMSMPLAVATTPPPRTHGCT
jgi:hypothetical protein